MNEDPRLAKREKLKRRVLAVSLLGCLALVAWLLVHPRCAALGAGRGPAQAPAQEQPGDRAIRSLDPELVSINAAFRSISTHPEARCRGCIPRQAA
jgi:hypothetical protein